MLRAVWSSCRQVRLLGSRRKKTISWRLLCTKMARKEDGATSRPKDMARYKYLYDHMDEENDGIKVCDLVKIVRELGLTATEEEIEKLFSSLNLKSYGVMTEEEFILFMSKIKTTSLGNLEVEPHVSDPSIDMEQPWWRRKIVEMKIEMENYKRGFRLLHKRLKFASKRIYHIVEGRTLSRYEVLKIFRAAKDFLILIPVAGAAMLPGGSIFIAFIVKYFPQFLPSTFRVENMTHQRRNELVLTEITAVIEEMELRLNMEKEEWTEADTSFRRMMENLLSEDCKSTSLERFLYHNELHFLEDTHITSGGIIDRLDSTWLLLLCQNCMSTAGSGKYDPQTIRQSPLPILRTLLRRRVQQIAQRSKSINNEKQKLPAERLDFDLPNLPDILRDRGFPPKLSASDAKVWMKLEDRALVLLALLFHMREKYIVLLNDPAKIKV